MSTGTDLVVCVEQGSGLQGGSQLGISRLIQQVESTWQAVWGHLADERHIRQVLLSSRDADNSELGINFQPSVIPLVLLW